MKKVAFFTLGCKVNYYDTESLKSLFEQNRYRLTGFEDKADVYVINTCTVTHRSDRKSRQMIRKARRQSKEAVIAVTGCYAQVYPEALKKMPEVDLIVGTNRRHLLPDLVEKVRSAPSPLVEVEPFTGTLGLESLPFYEGQERTRAFLKIQEGCDQGCSYCVVPRARGPARSKPPREIMEEVYRIASRGYRELVLTGIHLGLYGRERKGPSLAGIIRMVAAVSEIKRVRLSSLEPSDFTGELIDVISSCSKVCRHLHIPLQSGDDEILSRMNRPYNGGEYKLLIGQLRSSVPDLAVSTDIMVGFPGETRKHHRRSMELVRKLNFSRLHVFKYSPRPGTKACCFTGGVSSSEQSRRSKEMEALGLEMAADFRRSFLNTVQGVLVEKALESGEIEGLTQHYLRVRTAVDGSPRKWPGRLVEVKLVEEIPGEDFLRGELQYQA